MNVVDSMYNCIDSRLDSGFPQKNLAGKFVLVSFTCLKKNNRKVSLNPVLSRLCQVIYYYGDIDYPSLRGNRANRQKEQRTRVGTFELYVSRKFHR